MKLITSGMLLVGGIHDDDMLNQAVLDGPERQLGSRAGTGPRVLTTIAPVGGGDRRLSSVG
jgi:hypothetical protein